ncbi:MAG: hypothetical protein MOB07_20715 [Acidobacteria bacterium]|nr:hypothetical protein [Acidobacteriota bacterium]
MPAVQLTLTPEQLALAYAQMSAQERKSFLSAVVGRPEHREAALDLLRESRAILKKKFPAAKQRELDRLLTKNNEGKLSPSEQGRLEELVAEYGEGMIEKARALYTLAITDHVASSDE